MTAPLAEVVLWGNETVRAAKLARERDTADRRTRVFQMEQFFIEHGPLLLSVAAAAVEMREATKFYFGRHSIESDADGGSVRLANAASAFDAAARGEK